MEDTTSSLCYFILLLLLSNSSPYSLLLATVSPAADTATIATAPVLLAALLLTRIAIEDWAAST